MSFCYIPSSNKNAPRSLGAENAIHTQTSGMDGVPIIACSFMWLGRDHQPGWHAETWWLKQIFADRDCRVGSVNPKGQVLVIAYRLHYLFVT